MKTVPSERARHLVLQAEAGEILPSAITNALREYGVSAGWISGAGILADVDLKDSQSPDAGTKRIGGNLQIVSLEAKIGSPIRVALAREGGGSEIFVGEIERARIIAFEALAIVFMDVASRGEPARTTSASPKSPSSPPGLQTGNAVLPPKPGARRAAADEDEIYPEAGAIVDHFAFGRCEVVKSDGDRLHVRVEKDGRIREIILTVLRVTPLPEENGQARFKLERKV